MQIALALQQLHMVLLYVLICSASLTLIPAFSEIESIGYDGPELNVTIDDQNLVSTTTAIRGCRGGGAIEL